MVFVNAYVHDASVDREVETGGKPLLDIRRACPKGAQAPARCPVIRMIRWRGTSRELELGGAAGRSPRMSQAGAARNELPPAKTSLLPRAAFVGSILLFR